MTSNFAKSNLVYLVKLRSPPEQELPQTRSGNECGNDPLYLRNIAFREKTILKKTTWRPRHLQQRQRWCAARLPALLEEMQTSLQGIDQTPRDLPPPLTDPPHDRTRMTLPLFRIRRHLSMLPGEITRPSMWHAGLPQGGALLEMERPMAVNNITLNQHEPTIANDPVLALREIVPICRQEQQWLRMVAQ